jgi:hypothetical protein
MTPKICFLQKVEKAEKAVILQVEIKFSDVILNISTFTVSINTSFDL